MKFKINFSHISRYPPYLKYGTKCISIPISSKSYRASTSLLIGAPDLVVFPTLIPYIDPSGLSTKISGLLLDFFSFGVLNPLSGNL
jgi:hypothetical protein